MGGRHQANLGDPGGRYSDASRARRRCYIRRHRSQGRSEPEVGWTILRARQLGPIRRTFDSCICCSAGTGNVRRASGCSVPVRCAGAGSELDIQWSFVRAGQLGQVCCTFDSRIRCCAASTGADTGNVCCAGTGCSVAVRCAGEGCERDIEWSLVCAGQLGQNRCTFDSRLRCRAGTCNVRYASCTGCSVAVRCTGKG